VGTRHEDQPAEHWAGPESLDPTPVWKQYLLVAALLAVGLVVIVIVAVAALAPTFVTPPALVAGDRLVLAASELPAVGAPPKLVGAPIVTDARSFYLVQPAKGEIYAFRRLWPEDTRSAECEILPTPGPDGFLYLSGPKCPAGPGPRGIPVFDLRGASVNGFRGLDQYLVSVSGDRLVVNLSRLIRAEEHTNAPVPTGIPQPQQP
jgi:hypothetical protein